MTQDPARAWSVPQCPHLRNGSTNAFYDPGKEANHITDRGCESGQEELGSGKRATEGSTCLRRRVQRACELVVRCEDARGGQRLRADPPSLPPPLPIRRDPEALRPLCPEHPRLPITVQDAQGLTGKCAFYSQKNLSSFAVSIQKSCKCKNNPQKLVLYFFTLRKDFWEFPI